MPSALPSVFPSRLFPCPMAEHARWVRSAMHCHSSPTALVFAALRPPPVPYSRARRTLKAQAVRTASRAPPSPFSWQAGGGIRRAGRNPALKKAARPKSNPNPGINRGFAHAKGQCSAQDQQQCHRWKRYSSPHAYRALEANCPGQSLAVRLDHFFVRSVPIEITAGNRALQAAPSNQKNV